MRFFLLHHKLFLALLLRVLYPFFFFLRCRYPRALRRFLREAFLFFISLDFCLALFLLLLLLKFFFHARTLSLFLFFQLLARLCLLDAAQAVFTHLDDPLRGLDNIRVSGRIRLLPAFERLERARYGVPLLSLLDCRRLGEDGLFRGLYFLFRNAICPQIILRELERSINALGMQYLNSAFYKRILFSGKVTYSSVYFCPGSYRVLLGKAAFYLLECIFGQIDHASGVLQLVLGNKVVRIAAILVYFRFLFINVHLEKFS